MKKMIFYSILLCFLMLNIAATCNSDEEEPKPDGLQSFLGKWTFSHFEMNQTKTDGSIHTAAWNAEDKGINIFWEFKSNGDFIATEGNKSATGKWELKVTKLDESDPTLVEEGTLIISGVPSADEVAKELGMEKLTYKVHSYFFFYQGTYFKMFVVEVDASKAAPEYLKTIFKYTYIKRK